MKASETMKTHECKIGSCREKTMKFITTPRFSQNFRADMNSIGATWANIGGNGSWVFKPEHLTQVVAWARFYFPVAVVESAAPIAEPVRTPAEQFAVAMGLGLMTEEDLF